MNVLSLFSGVGGFDLGLEAAGHRTVFQCEWDKHATRVLERHWPDVPRWGDISTLTAAHILAHAPVVDVVAWGSPCQDLSVAGRRAGLGGSRSGLFHEGMRVIRELREATNGKYPRISVWENVYGALNSNKGADFGVILDEMAAAGALVQEWRVLDAQYFGVPQRRRRVFLVSVFDPAVAERCPEPLLPVREGVRWHPSTGRSAGQAAPGTAATGFGNSGFERWSDTDTAITLSARDYKGGNTVIVDLPPPEGHGGEPAAERPILIDRSAFNQGQNAQYDTYISDHPVIPTLVARGPHAVAHRDSATGSSEHRADAATSGAAMLVRRLTPVECERLMGWPDDWTAGQADGHRYKQCGNGVASPVAEWIGQQLAQLDH